MKSETNWNTTFVVVILAAALGLAGLFWWNAAHDDMLRIQPRPVFDAVNEGQFDATMMQKGNAGVLNASLYLRVLPPSTKEEGRTVQVIAFQKPELTLRDDDSNRKIKSACILFISLQISSSESPQTGYGELVSSDQPLCHEMTDNDYFYETFPYIWTSDVTGDQEGSIDLDHIYYNVRMDKGEMQSYEEFNPLVVGSNFWFPYDPFILTLDTQVMTSVEYDDGSIIYQYPPAYIEFQLLPSGGRPWDIVMKNQIKKDSDDETMISQETQLSLTRPLLFRIAFPLIIGAMVLFIAMIPQIANPNVETVLGIMASLLFATFAVRSLLSPGDQIGQTIIDIAILGLYVLLVLAGALLMWRVKRFKKIDSE